MMMAWLVGLARLLQPARCLWSTCLRGPAWWRGAARWLGVGRLLWLAPLLLAGCGTLPQPFLGNPGATGRILAQPPTPRLAVPVPPQALLPDQSAESFAQALSVALQSQEVPAVEGPAQPGDWHLAV